MKRYTEQMTLTEVAYQLGISRQRVKQIENVALEKLRKNKKMRSFYETINTERASGIDSNGNTAVSVYLGHHRTR